MKRGANIAARAASRFYVPLIALFALSLMAARAPGVGVGFVAGLALAVTLAVHVLIAGAGAARRAAPPALARALLCAGLAAVAVGAGAPRLIIAPQLLEGGLFVVTVSAAALFLTVLIGRAPTLREDA